MRIALMIIDTIRHDVFETLKFVLSIKNENDVLMLNSVFALGTSTPFSFPGILSSEYAFVSESMGLTKAAITLAEVFKEHGFSTYGNGGGNYHLIDVRGYSRGFDVYDPVLKVNLFERILRKIPAFYKSWRNVKNFFKLLLNRPFVLPARRMLKEAMKFLESHENSFVFLDLMDVHRPYIGILKKSLFERFKLWKLMNVKYLSTDEEELSQWKDYYVKVYKEAAMHVDTLLEEFFNWLDVKGILKDTLVVITSDHGEEFLEHGGLDHRPKPFDEIIHVPLMIYVGWETFSETDKQRAENKLVSLIDLPQSLVYYLFGEKRREFMGREILFSDGERDYVYSEGWRKPGKPYHDPTKKGIHNYAFRTKKWKYMVLEGKECFYDLEKDPLEKNCLEVPDSIREEVEEFKKDLKREELRHRIYMKK